MNLLQKFSWFKKCFDGVSHCMLNRQKDLYYYLNFHLLTNLACESFFNYFIKNNFAKKKLFVYYSK